MHLAWRWFTGLGFDQAIPHHSTFSKNRHWRFQESNLFEELFEQIVRQCVEAGLLSHHDPHASDGQNQTEHGQMLSSSTLLLNLILLIDVTFSTPTGYFSA